MELMDVTIIWKLDGPFMCTLLQYPDTDMQRQAMQQWSVKDYVDQAHDVEFPDEPNLIAETGYEVIAIIRGDIQYIY